MTAIGMGIGIPFNQQGFSPFAIGEPVFLFDAALGITLNGADVSDWADQSGSGIDLSQGTAVDQPLYNASDADFNGNPSVQGDGVTEYLRSGDFVLAQPESIFLVYKMGDLVGTQTLFSGNATGDVTAYRTSTTTGQMRTGGTAQAIHTEDTNANTLGLLYNAGSSNSWHNGTSTVPAASVGTQGLGGLTVFANQSALNFANVKIPYLLAYDFILTAAQRNYVGGGLANRFGTTNGWV